MAHDGVEVDTQGDAFFVAFPTAPGALAAAGEAQRSSSSGPMRVRMGIHTGTPHVGEEGYVGIDVTGRRGSRPAGTAGRCSSPRPRSRSLGREGCATSASIGSRICPRRSASISSATATSRRCDEPAPDESAVPSTPFLGRERELAEVGALLSREGRSARDPDGAGRHRQDAARPAGGRPSLRGVPATASAGSRWRRSVTRELVAGDAPRRRSAPRTGSPTTSGTSACSSCSTTSSRSSTRRPTSLSSSTSCPNLDLLVTSREPLHVAGEQEYPVPPLAREEGVGFFLARAHAADPDFVEPTRPSRRSAAAWTTCPSRSSSRRRESSVLAPEQMLERLEQRLDLLTGGRATPTRAAAGRCGRRSSGATSCSTADEQRLFARLAVFGGGCTLEATEEVCERRPRRAAVARRQEPRPLTTDERFWMLETIREYAAERLEESGEVECARATARRALHGAGARRGSRHLHRTRLQEIGSTGSSASTTTCVQRLTTSAQRASVSPPFASQVRCHGSGEPTATATRAGADRGGASEATRACSCARRRAERGCRPWPRRRGSSRHRGCSPRRRSRSIARARETLRAAPSPSGNSGMRSPRRWCDWADGRRLSKRASSSFAMSGDEHSILRATRTLAFSHHLAGEPGAHEGAARREPAAGEGRFRANAAPRPGCWARSR